MIGWLWYQILKLADDRTRGINSLTANRMFHICVLAQKNQQKVAVYVNFNHFFDAHRFIEALVAAIFCTSYDQNICGNSACHKQYHYELFQLQHNNNNIKMPYL